MSNFTMATYRNDPRPLQVRWNCQCAKCSISIKKGQTALYWPADKKILCYLCGEDDYNAFLSSACDEEVLQGTGNPYYG